MAETLKVNDGNGIMDHYGLIESCVKDLCSIKIRVDELSTTGVLIVDIINRLDTLKDGLKKEEREGHQSGPEADTGRWNNV